MTTSLLFCIAQPHLSPDSPILLYPVNRTFSITCSLLCEPTVDLDQLVWLVDGQALLDDPRTFHRETLSSHSQRLTVLLNKKNHHFPPTNYTCRYKDKESSILVRRRTSTIRSVDHIFLYFFDICFRRRIASFTSSTRFFIRLSPSNSPLRYRSTAVSIDAWLVGDLSSPLANPLVCNLIQSALTSLSALSFLDDINDSTWSNRNRSRTKEPEYSFPKRV